MFSADSRVPVVPVALLVWNRGKFSPTAAMDGILGTYFSRWSFSSSFFIALAYVSCIWINGRVLCQQSLPQSSRCSHGCFRSHSYEVHLSAINVMINNRDVANMMRYLSSSERKSTPGETALREFKGHIAVPFNKNGLHWTLLLIHLDGTASYIDSLGEKSGLEESILAQWVCYSWKPTCLLWVYIESSYVQADIALFLSRWTNAASAPALSQTIKRLTG